MTSRKRILIVDDDASIRAAVADALTEEGYDPVLSVHGEDALRLLDGGLRPDAILLDNMMPVMDGATFAAHVLASAAHRHLPVILMTADKAAEQRARAIGLQAFLRKPVALDDLIAAVERATAPRL
jgi:CheY-like chemotaxis protein